MSALSFITNGFIAGDQKEEMFIPVEEITVDVTVDDINIDVTVDDINIDVTVDDINIDVVVV